MITIKSEREIKLMREAGKLVSQMYEYAEKIIKPGLSTYELDKMLEKFVREKGGIPAQINYPSGVKGVPPFPASTCISVNDVIIHGIPDKQTILKNGDIVKIDTVIEKNGYNGDAARTFLIGDVDPEVKRLADVTKQAFFEALKFAKVGYRIGDISYAVQEYVLNNGFDVIKEFQGHGIGKEMHEDPGVPNYGKPGKGPRLEEGMTICIEPMVTQFSPEIWELEDGWGIVTQDGGMTAHYENTILITKGEPEILTL